MSLEFREEEAMPIRVCMVVNNLDVGGLEKVVLSLLGLVGTLLSDLLLLWLDPRIRLGSSGR